jgi:preprotein translocase subunit Sss1
MMNLREILSSLLETFETSSDVTSDPKNNVLTLKDVLDKFSSFGGKILGSGAFGCALMHPKWNFVVKIFSQDDAYLKFVRFVLRNPRNSYPKFLDKPRRFLPNFRRPAKDEYMYIIRMEKLEPLPRETWSEMSRVIWTIEAGKQPQEDVLKNMLAVLKDKHPNIVEFIRDFRFFADYARFLRKTDDFGYMDLHDGNLMTRKNGDLVLIDPFVGGHPKRYAHNKHRQPKTLFGGKPYNK